MKGMQKKKVWKGDTKYKEKIVLDQQRNGKVDGKKRFSRFWPNIGLTITDFIIHRSCQSSF